ncbi:CBN-ASP-6 protein, partial [Aphelenchoides avenae]
IATSGFGDGVPGMVPLLLNAKQRGIVKHNMFTIALKREGNGSANLPGGTITYGDLDMLNCGTVKAYVPSIDIRPTYVYLDAVSFGGFQAAPPRGAQWIATVDLSST